MKHITLLTLGEVYVEIVVSIKVYHIQIQTLKQQKLQQCWS